MLTNLFLCVLFNLQLFLIILIFQLFKGPSKTGCIMGTPRQAVSIMILLSNSNCCCPFFMKLVENVYGHNYLAKFENQPNHFSHFRVRALLFIQKWQILLVCSLTPTVVVRSSSNLRKMFMDIIS